MGFFLPQTCLEETFVLTHHFLKNWTKERKLIFFFVFLLWIKEAEL
jgi:hypothetical protein